MTRQITHASRRSLLLAAACGLATATGTALSQDATPPLLTGPSVELTEDAPTLVNRGFDGQMERERIMPETAAIDLLELSDTERAAVDAVLAERAALIDGIVKQNMALVQQMHGARQAKDRTALREAMTELRVELQPALDQGPLVELVAAALPESARGTYAGLVEEYRVAARESRRAQRAEAGEMAAPGERRARRGPPPEMDGPDGLGGPLDGLGRGDMPPPDAMDAPPPRERAGRRGGRGAGQAAAMQSVMVEVTQSYARLVTERQERKGEFDDLLGQLDLSAEQRAAIEATLAAARENRGARTGDDAQQPSREDRMQLMRSIAQELTPEQRRQFRTLLRERRGR